MRGDLKPGYIPRGIAVRRPLHHPKLHFVSSLCCTDAQGEGYLEQGLVLVPVDAGMEVDAADVMVQPDFLLQPRTGVLPRQPQHGYHRAIRNDARLAQIGYAAHLFLVVDVDIPGVELHWAVFESLEIIACLPRGDPLTAC